ncbi:MAG: S8 family serine peptidase, partial [bacterium]
LPSRTLDSAVKYAWNRGAVVACAAGNSNSSQKTYPAAYANCIAVGATDENDAKASFSSFGPNWVDVAAPGERILSTLPPCEVPTWLTLVYGYGCLYDSLRGTSMATPHVAGLAALVWARYGLGNTAAFVRSKVETTADSPGAGVYWKWGRVNYCKAVEGSCSP